MRFANMMTCGLVAASVSVLLDDTLNQAWAKSPADQLITSTAPAVLEDVGAGRLAQSVAKSTRAVWTQDASGSIIGWGGQVVGVDLSAGFMEVPAGETNNPCLDAGALDPQFGNGGIVTDTIGYHDSGYDVAIQTDGKILISGYDWQVGFAVARYLGDGLADVNFGADGKVRTGFPFGGGRAHAIAVYDDGRILAAGGAYDTRGWDDFALARYHPNGNPDTEFGSGGKVLTAFGSFVDTIKDVAIQPDGKIVAGGYAHNGSDYDFALARYNTDGSLDVSFDSDGRVTTDFGKGNDRAEAVSLLAGGMILVAGYAHNGSNYDFALARYNSDGSLDISFGTDGKQSTPVGTGDDYATAMAMLDDGKIILSGYAYNGSKKDDFALIRLETDGSLDGTFGANGKVLTDFAMENDWGYDLAIQADGKIVVAGTAYHRSLTYFDFALARYDSNGEVDATFDGDGKVVTASLSGVNHNDQAYAVAIQPGGNILAVGYSALSSSVWHLAMARYITTGGEPCCGDGVVDPGEQCDDAMFNGTGEAYCLSDCSGIQICGDATVHGPPLGTELCDDGPDNGAGDGFCFADCSGIQYCRDVRVLWSRPVGFQPMDIKTGDVDGDGRPNVVIGPSENRIEVLDYVGEPLWDFATGGWPWYVTVGDLDGDSRKDVVGMTSQQPYTLYAVSGFGTSLWSRTLPVTGSGNEVAEHVVIADVDDDGSNEVVVAPNALAAIYVFDHLGNTKWVHDLGYRGFVAGLRVGDIDGDDVDDIVACYGYRASDPNGIVVLDGWGGTIWEHSNPVRLGNAAIGDLDGDGKNDVVAGEWDASTGQMLYAFSSSGAVLWSYPIVGRVDDILVADLDGDHVNEVAVSSWDNRLRLISADGTLQWELALPGRILKLEVADTDANGSLELLCAGSDGRTRAFDARGRVVWEHMMAGHLCRDLAVADFTGDGIDDVVVVSRPPNPEDFDGIAYVLTIDVCGLCTDDADCPDDNPCTGDICDAGTCTNPPKPADTPCGNPVDTECDNPDTCDGTGTCLSNVEPAGVVCRPTEGLCDIEETCNGMSPDCPPDLFEPDTTECRPSAGVCDVAEFCTGESAACPLDAFAPTTVQCRAEAGECGVPEFCTGEEADCPLDEVHPFGMVCRPEEGLCDIEEVCDGDSPHCPSDVLAGPERTCRAAVGECDTPETCTGSTPDCPEDSLLPGSAECRPAQGECDMAEFCTGSDSQCPPDEFAPLGSTCGDSGDSECDDPDSCDGAGICVPNYAPLGLSCDDGETCNGVDACDGSGHCISHPLNDCNENEVEDSCDIADGTSQDCNENAIPDECDIADGASPDDNGNGVPDECEVTADLNIRPGDCPNPLLLGPSGIVQMAVVGTPSFDVEAILADTLILTDVDGSDVSIAPLGAVVIDVATPFEGDLCDCHDLDGDGTDDLAVWFWADDINDAFMPRRKHRLPSTTLTVGGMLENGGYFEASDCVVVLRYAQARQERKKPGR